MSGPPRLRVGVIGLGVGAQHLAAYAQDPRCEVAAVCDASPERLAAVRGLAPGAAALVDAAELLADPSLDLVSIASYDQDHADQALAALRSGKHAFVEKPLCRTASELRALADAHRRRPDLVLGSNLVLRAAPLFAWLREARRSGDLGDVYAFDGDYLYGRLEKITSGWRGRVEGYSVMLGGGIHLVDLMIWCLGERPDSVTAAGNRIAAAGTGFRYEDYVAATFTFPSGAIGRVTANFGCVHRHQHVVRVFGTRATVVGDDRGARISRERDPAESRDLALSPLPASKGALIPALVDAALGGAPQDPGPRHELDVVAACLAADRSMRTGTAVEIEYP
jgi:predicted dehydrogenase